VITHGLPYPENLTLALDMEQTIRQHGGVPATIAVLQGQVTIGLDTDQLAQLAQGKQNRKISSRDLGTAIAHGADGGTTVAGTIFVAYAAGIPVFATGGIGGVHHEPPFDISADLIQLSKTPLIVVCAGAKAILNLPATMEYLETFSIPVVGFQTNEFPGFYSTTTGLKTNSTADTPEGIVAIARAHWQIGMTSAVLVVQPPPQNVALSNEKVDKAVQEALSEAKARNIHGQAVTPFLLERVSELTGGASLQANLALLTNNAELATRIAVHFNQSNL
jgi:pseudouridine-5'-phosphate glycosidase